MLEVWMCGQRGGRSLVSRGNLLEKVKRHRVLKGVRGDQAKGADQSEHSMVCRQLGEEDFGGGRSDDQSVIV